MIKPTLFYLAAAAVPFSIGCNSSDAEANSDLLGQADAAAPVEAPGGRDEQSSRQSSHRAQDTASIDRASPTTMANGDQNATDAKSNADSTEIADVTQGDIRNSGEAEGECKSFDSTFEAIQYAVFERHGCTEAACHGEAAVAELDLRPDQAYRNLFEVPAVASSQMRISPGLPSESFLYQKLRAASQPGSVEVAGSPMPIGLPAVTPEELDAMRVWITAGAPESGSVGDSTRLGGSDVLGEQLGACLPPAEPVAIAPLEAPPTGIGAQLKMPVFRLPAAKEVEICFATYYDLSEQVPERFKTEDGTAFYINGLTLRQDANSHHLVVTNPGIDPALAHDPSFGNWLCYGGERAGESCEPLESTSCGADGQCATELSHQVTCNGFGPVEAVENGFVGGVDGSIVASQTAQYNEAPRDGVYRRVPIKGFLYYNSHAFNLTMHDHQMHARTNLYFTDDLRYRRISKPNASAISAAAGTPPFERATVCAEHEMPVGSELIGLGSHTHKRGERFWAEGPDGSEIYESLVYSDPVYKDFDPPLVFDSEDPAARTVRYCATFNNGVLPDGAPDVGLVTRYSTMPDRTSCEPTACAEGKVGAQCAGLDDHDACDSSPGAGDGLCDACPITGGPTTENSMFVLTPTYIQR